jgi:uncharacterized membrane protein YbhN (UPF0104 family)
MALLPLQALLRWLYTNAEFSAAALATDLSVTRWADDDAFAFEGDHVWLPGAALRLCGLTFISCIMLCDASRVYLFAACYPIGSYCLQLVVQAAMAGSSTSSQELFPSCTTPQQHMCTTEPTG